MGALQNRATLLKVCRLHYESGLSQKEISSLLGISPPQISRALQSARQCGMVRIAIQDPCARLSRAEQGLIAAYGLKDAFVAPPAAGGRTTLLQEFGRQCAPQLEARLSAHSIVGVSSGKTLAGLVQALGRLDRPGIEFVPLVGGITSSGGEWQANNLAKSLAEKSSGTYQVLNAPVRMQTTAARDMLLQESAIRTVLEKGRHCDVALVSIGQISEAATAYYAGALTVQDVRELRQCGAVASVCTSFFDRRGRCLELPLSRRSIGYQLRRSHKGRVVALVAGIQKLEAARAVLAGGYIDVLFTTLELAETLLNTASLKEEKP